MLQFCLPYHCELILLKLFQGISVFGCISTKFIDEWVLAAGLKRRSASLVPVRSYVGSVFILL